MLTKAFRRLKRLGIVVSFTMILVSVIAVLVVAGTEKHRAEPANPISYEPNSPLLNTAQPQRQRRIAQIETELITVRRYGFEPSEIRRPAGRFLLMIDNRSELETLGLRLSLERGVRLRDIGLPREQLEWSEVVDLQPGVYLLTEAGHPRWVCPIIITP